MPNCKIDDCTRQAHGLDLCSMHYQRLRKHGDPHQGGRRVQTAACVVDGCDRPARTRDCCPRHYRRLHRYGNPTAIAPPRAKVPSSRYEWSYGQAHPIACADGKILTHRKVLFGKIGPGEHPCFWCGLLVIWAARTKPFIGVLVVDHVDHDFQNNDPANLVPSCPACNAHRLTDAVWTPWVPGTARGERSREHSHCRRGHLMSAENVYRNPSSGNRQCRRCLKLMRAARDAARRGERRAAAA